MLINFYNCQNDGIGSEPGMAHCPIKLEVIYFLYCNPISFHFASINVYDFLKNSTIRNYYFFTCCILTITSDKK